MKIFITTFSCSPDSLTSVLTIFTPVLMTGIYIVVIMTMFF